MSAENGETQTVDNSASEATTQAGPMADGTVGGAGETQLQEGPVAGCDECGVVGTQEDRFCEACGQALSSAPGSEPASNATAGPAFGTYPTAAPGVPPIACGDCGGVYADGYCSVCGAKAPIPRDHVVLAPQPWVAAVSDRGIRHYRNEDATAVAADPAPGSRAILVVCDGVSTSLDSDVASLAAAEAARDVLLTSRPQGMFAESGSIGLARVRLEAAVDAASDAVTASTLAEHGQFPPSCTFVAALVEQGRIVVGVVGDSRAYWVPDDGEASVLTVDDSWAAEQIAHGLPRAEAESGPRAHAITRWLGVDAPDHTPRLTTMTVDAPGWLVVCSDGLWNYCSSAQDLGAMVLWAAATASGEPVATASGLVDWANSQGGRDNITVALARFGAVAPRGSDQATNRES